MIRDTSGDCGDDVLNGAGPARIEDSAAARATAAPPARDDAPDLAKQVSRLAGPNPLLAIERLIAGYGNMSVLHGIDLQLAAGQSICLIGPNGAGKSTVLNALYGFAAIRGGTIKVEGRDVTRTGPSDKLSDLGIAYLLQGNSVFPDMTVEQNLRLGGYLKGKKPAREAADGIFDLYPRLAARRKHPARMLSGGERRLLEIARALVMNPRILLVDEPSIGLEPRYTQMIFELLRQLQRERGMSILMVEQNVRAGLQFADVGYALTAGKVVAVAPAAELLSSRAIERLFSPA